MPSGFRDISLTVTVQQIPEVHGAVARKQVPAVFRFPERKEGHPG